MHCVCVLAILVTYGCLVLTQAVLEKQCDKLTAGSNIRVSVDIQRNQTGHWISQVSLLHKSQHKSVFASKQMKPWKMEVDQNIEGCERDESSLDVTLTLTARPPTVGPDYKLFPGIGYYKFHTDFTTWQRAREICAEEGAHLVIINSEEESDVMRKLFQPHPKLEGATHNDYAMIGILRDTGTEHWITVFSDPLNSTKFTRWGPNEPKKEAIHDIALVSRFDGSMHNYRGDVNSSFICEQELW